jgi:hypothetical protein
MHALQLSIAAYENELGEMLPKAFLCWQQCYNMLKTSRKIKIVERAFSSSFSAQDWKELTRILKIPQSAILSIKYFNPKS